MHGETNQRRVKHRMMQWPNQLSLIDADNVDIGQFSHKHMPKINPEQQQGCTPCPMPMLMKAAVVNVCLQKGSLDARSSCWKPQGIFDHQLSIMSRFSLLFCSNHGVIFVFNRCFSILNGFYVVIFQKSMSLLHLVLHLIFVIASNFTVTYSCIKLQSYVSCRPWNLFILWFTCLWRVMQISHHCCCCTEHVLLQVACCILMKSTVHYCAKCFRHTVKHAGFTWS